MSKVLALSEATYERLLALAQERACVRHAPGRAEDVGLVDEGYLAFETVERGRERSWKMVGVEHDAGDTAAGEGRDE